MSSLFETPSHFSETVRSLVVYIYNIFYFIIIYKWVYIYIIQTAISFILGLGFSLFSLGG
jgi:hypothetical protein